MTALAAMQEHLLSPYASIQCTPTATYGLDKQVFKNWDPYVNRPMTLPEALAHLVRHLLLRRRQPVLRGGRAGGQPPAGMGQRWGFGAPTGLDIGNEARRTVMPTPAWRKKTFKSDWDKAWNPGDSIQLAIGQKDVTVTPLQMARFYAMIANGGKLVTPYVVAGVEQPGANGQRAVTLKQFTPDPPRDAGVDPAALQAVRDGLYAATHSTKARRRECSRRSRSRSRARRGPRKRSSTPRVSGRPPRGSVVVVRLRAGRRCPPRRLCGDRERRPRLVRRCARRPAVFEKYFGVKAGPQILVDVD